MGRETKVGRVWSWGIVPRVPTWKVLLGILLTSLCRLANLLSDNLPLVVLVFFDRTHQRRALQGSQSACLARGIG